VKNANLHRAEIPSKQPILIGVMMEQASNVGTANTMIMIKMNDLVVPLTAGISSCRAMKYDAGLFGSLA